MKRTNTVILGQLVNDILKEYQIDNKLREGRIIAAWPHVLGPLAKTTKNLYIKNGVLFAAIESSVVRNELLMRKTTLMNALNEKAGENIITNIVFR